MAFLLACKNVPSGYCHLDETRIALGDLFVNVVLLPFLATFISR